MVVSRIEGATAGPSVPVAKTPSRRALKATRIAYKILEFFATVANNAASIVGQFYKLPRAARIGLDAAALPIGIAGFSGIKGAADDVKIVFDKSKGSVAKFEAVCQFLVHLESVVQAVASSLAFLRTVGAVGLRVVKWIPIFNIVSYIVGFISLGLASFSVHKSRKLLAAFEVISGQFNKATSDEKRAELLEDAIKLIEKEGIEPLRQELRLSKEAGKSLQKRIDHLRALSLPTQEKTQAIADMNEAFIILKGRMKVQLGFKCADLAAQVVGVVAGALMFTPLAPVGFGIVIATSVCSLVTFAGQTYFINKNPFDPISQTKAEKLLDKIQKGLNCIKRAIHVSGVAKKHLKRAQAQV
jgi:hypothetical protein